MNNFENIRLEKGLYSTGKSFSQVLESLDPGENYKGTSLEGLDAFQRQLKRFDIHVNGKNSDRLEKFFSTAESATLFPEYVNRAVRRGIEQANRLDRIVATTTKIDSPDYRSITSISDDNSKELKIVGEGAAIPQTRVVTRENLVPLKKRGRMLVGSYEALKFQRLDLFTVTLRQIGSYIARSQLKDAVDVLLDGDGNNNAAQVLTTAQSGILTYEDLVKLWSKFDPYEMTTLIVPSDVMVQLLKLPEFRDPLAGLDFHGTGRCITPLGAEIIRCDSVPAGKIIALDRKCALEKVQAGDIITDYDKLIDRQIERAAITAIAGFSKIYDDASMVLTQ